MHAIRCAPLTARPSAPGLQGHLDREAQIAPVEYHELLTGSVRRPQAVADDEDPRGVEGQPSRARHLVVDGGPPHLGLPASVDLVLHDVLALGVLGVQHAYVEAVGVPVDHQGADHRGERGSGIWNPVRPSITITRFCPGWVTYTR